MPARMRRTILLALAAAAPSLAAPGLVATYSDGAVTLREVVPSPNFYLDPGETLHPALQEDFGAVFRGRLSIPQNGRYEFFAGQAELEIDNRPVAGPRFLTAGDHELQLRYSSARDEHGLRLEWQGPGFGREPVPERLFRHAPADAPRPVERLAETGRRLAVELGCANCHVAAPTLAKRPGPPLDGIGARANAAWLKHWLDNPQAFRASAVMPRAAHRSDANDLAEYLMTLTGEAPPEPRSHNSEAGGFLFQDLGCIACHGKEGVSLLGLGSKTTAAHLQRYLLDPFTWDPSGRMPAFELSEAQAGDLGAYLALSRKPAFERQPLGGDADRGRRRYENAGCAACHQLEGVVNRLAAPRMVDLDPERGCLADEPSEPAPLFALEPEARQALRAYVAFYAANPDRTRAPIHDFRARLAQLRCNACHEVEGRPAQTELRQPAPALTGLGEWMETSSLRRALSEPVRDFEPLGPQMPQYHPQHVGVLAAGFAKAAGIAPGSPPLTPPPARPARELTEARPAAPRDDPVVLRRALPEAPDALVVRLPGEVFYAFDPREVRLLYAWREPAGVFYRQTAFPIRVDDPERIPQRQFLGHETADGAPEMHYQADGVDVYERVMLRRGELVRQFRLPKIDRPMWLILASNEGARVTTSLGSGLERLQLPRGENIRFEVRIAVR